MIFVKFQISPDFFQSFSFNIFSLIAISAHDKSSLVAIDD